MTAQPIRTKKKPAPNEIVPCQTSNLFPSEAKDRLMHWEIQIVLTVEPCSS